MQLFIGTVQCQHRNIAAWPEWNDTPGWEACPAACSAVSTRYSASLVSSVYVSFKIFYQFPCMSSTRNIFYARCWLASLVSAHISPDPATRSFSPWPCCLLPCSSVCPAGISARVLTAAVLLELFVIAVCWKGWLVAQLYAFGRGDFLSWGHPSSLFPNSPWIENTPISSLPWLKREPGIHAY